MPRNSDSCVNGHSFVDDGRPSVSDKGTPKEVTRQNGRCIRPGCRARATKLHSPGRGWSGWYQTS